MVWLEIMRTLLVVERENKKILDKLSFLQYICGMTFSVVALLGRFIDQR